ncbi:MAG: cytochrome c peroxidase [Saprospiraceae bacterium]
MNKIVYILPILAFVLIQMGGCIDEPEPEAGIDLSGINYDPKPYIFGAMPSSYPAMEIPADNPMTIDGVQLGRHLFFDPILSADSSMSCISCHNPASSFTDGKAVSVGIDGISGIRSSMSLLDIGFAYKGLFWDGRSKDLEDQAGRPVEDPIELHHTWPNLEIKLQNSVFYQSLFRKAFGISNSKEITKDLATKAIAQFERIIVSSGTSKFDQFLAGKYDLSEDEYLGYDLFFDVNVDVPDAQCGHCHNAPFMTVNDYFNNGIQSADSLNQFKDFGHGNVTKKPLDNGKFKVPTLRNIALSAPYMHDGSFASVEAVIDHYDSGGHYSPNKDPLIAKVHLTTLQKSQILSFLHTLTDTVALKNPLFINPFD